MPMWFRVWGPGGSSFKGPDACQRTGYASPLATRMQPARDRDIRGNGKEGVSPTHYPRLHISVHFVLVRAVTTEGGGREGG